MIGVTSSTRGKKTFISPHPEDIYNNDLGLAVEREHWKSKYYFGIFSISESMQYL